MIHVLVVDDHPIVRQGLTQLIRDTPDMKLCGEAESFEGLWSVLDDDAISVDVLLLDIKMPGGDILDALSRLAKRHPEVATVVVSTYPEDQFLVRVLRAGASGYLEKARPAEDIRDAVRTVATGRRYITAAGARILADALGRGAGPAHDQLSDREFQVLRLLASGRSVGEIAEALHLSVKTVSTYRTRMLDKLSLSNDAEAIRYALERELAE